jgi:signal peptidase
MGVVMEPTKGQANQQAGRSRSVTGRILAAAAATIVAVCFLATAILILLPAFGRVLGHRTMVITTGSMTPTIHPGDAIVLEDAPAGTIQAGDAITFATPPAGELVTHRVIAVREIAGQIWFQTQGDANELPDPDLTPAAAVEGKVRWTVPRVGPVLVGAVSRWGTLLLLGVPALLLLVREAMAFRAVWRPGRRRGRGWTDRPAAA